MERLARSLDRHCVDEGVKEIHLDLQGVEFLNSDGLARLLHLRRRSQERGKKLIVVGAEGQVREKLRLMGVLEILEAGL